MKWLTMQMSRSVTHRLQNAYRKAIDGLYPQRCPICGEIVDNSQKICPDCGLKVKYIVEPFCMICGKSLDNEEEELCRDCMQRNHKFDRGIAAFSYTDELRNSIYQFKYDNKREYADFYGDSIAKLRGSIIKSWRPDVLIPVPLHISKLRRRGFNQAELVAREIGKRLNIPVDSKILTRCVNTAPQKTLDEKERAKNIKNAFQVTDNIVKYNKIVLIDDIYTTGTTIDECAAALKKSGVQRVYFASVCIGRGF